VYLQYGTTDEETNRFNVFKDNLAKIDLKNRDEATMGGRATHGVTKFADRTQDEFRVLLGYVPNDIAEKDKAVEQSAATERSETSAGTNATFANWVGIYTTPVKNQGYCGSCWAFSATEQIESDSIIAGLTTKYDYFSEQQIVDCDNGDFGCGGGDTETAYIYVKNTGGIEKAEVYPYVSKDGISTNCTSDSSEYVVTVDHYSHVFGEDFMVEYVLETGPLSVCLDASNWASYENGILHNCGQDVDHCVQVVGVDTDQNYWIVRNSWGTDWGVDGYIFLNLYNNTCDITNDPTHVKPSAV
jgi:C1A family cysteine protease